MTIPTWEHEIRDLHQFFAAWFTGHLPATDAAFQRVAAVLDSNFALITPDGRIVARDALFSGLRTAHGSQPGLRIWIADAVLRFCNLKQRRTDDE